MTDTIQERLRHENFCCMSHDFIEETATEAADEIDRLERELSEKDKHIEELERDLCVLENINSNAAALLDDAELAYEEAVEKAIKELDRAPRLESDLLYVEFAEKDASIARLDRELAEAKSGHLITTEQIDQAWKIAHTPGYNEDNCLDVLYELGIRACPKCGGTKYWHHRDGSITGCDCPNNGWVRRDNE